MKTLIVLAAVVLVAPCSDAAVGGGGPNIIPSFVTMPGGGSPVATVVCNPSSTYLPVSDNPAQTYLYQAIWDFGDGTVVTVPGGLPGAAAAALSPIAHAYATEGLFTVKFTVNIWIVNAGSPANNISTMTPGPSASATGVSRVATVNYPPAPKLINNSSPATGEIPYTLTVNPGTSLDEDGFILWAAINWGDGSVDLVSPLPPTVPPVAMTHVYTAPGIYRVTLSVIDNGRLPAGTTLSTVPDARDPVAAQQAITTFMLNNPAMPGELLDPKYYPQLKADFLLVQVPGNMLVRKAQFQVDFVQQFHDKLLLQMQSHVFPDNISHAAVSVTVGTQALTMNPFVTDAKGRYKDSSLGLVFAFNGRKRTVTLKLSKAALAAAMGLTNSTAVNANVDVPIVITVGTFRLATTARFVYNAIAGQKGSGKNGQSYPAGN